jgi:hypothetical protein
MDEWNGEWSSREERLMERSEKAWAALEAWVSERKAKRDKELDDYLERKRNGRDRASAAESRTDPPAA